MNWIQSFSAVIRVKGLCTKWFLILVSPKYKLYQIRCIIQQNNPVTQNDSCVCELQLVKQAISFYRVGVYTKESVWNKPKYYQNDVTMKPTSPIDKDYWETEIDVYWTNLEFN